MQGNYGEIVRLRGLLGNHRKRWKVDIIKKRVQGEGSGGMGALWGVALSSTAFVVMESQEPEMYPPCQPGIGSRGPDSCLNHTWEEMPSLHHQEGLGACIHVIVYDVIQWSCSVACHVLWSYGLTLSLLPSSLPPFLSPSFPPVSSSFYKYLLKSYSCWDRPRQMWRVLWQGKDSLSCCCRTFLVLWDRDMSIGAYKWIWKKL